MAKPKNSRPGSAEGGSIPRERLAELLRLMEEEGLQELEIGEEGSFLRVVKRGAHTPVEVYHEAGAGEGPSAINDAAAKLEGGHPVVSPIHGVFYRSASPTTPPFVNEGDTVESGRTLCIVEAMKVMNEIKSPVGGRIRRILCENGKPVATNEPMFLIATEG